MAENFIVNNVVWGRGSISYLENISGEKAIIITDKTLVNLGLVEKLSQRMKKSVSEVKVFDEIEPEPSIETVLKAVNDNRDYTPDLIVGIGGGSCIDASKAFRVFIENPHLTFADVISVGAPPKVAVPPFKTTTHVAIPSTSGTGSEASKVAIITDHKINAKCPIISPNMIPNFAILDPDIPDNMPKKVAADTGLDALAHGLESLVSVKANDFSLGPALRSIILAMNHLADSVLKSDQLAREKVHYAACLAGMSFVNAGGNCIAHSISTQVGNFFHLTHGLATGIALPYTVKFNKRAAGPLYAEVSRLLGCKESDTPKAVDYLVAEIFALMEQVGVPTSYQAAGISLKDFAEKRDEMVTRALPYPTTMFNPRKPTREELSNLFDVCFDGDYRRIQ